MAGERGQVGRRSKEAGEWRRWQGEPGPPGQEWRPVGSTGEMDAVALEGPHDSGRGTGRGGCGQVSYCTEKKELGLCRWPEDQWSPHMGKFTKVNTLNSVMMEKHRNTPYRKRQPHPSFLSSCHLFR